MFKRNLILITASALALTACGKQAVPAGAVVAFNLNSCPKEWRAFEQAQGRFVRGYNPNVTSPISIGATTEGQVGHHKHTMEGARAEDGKGSDHFPQARVGRVTGDPEFDTTGPVTTNIGLPDHMKGENLPKAVTLLYCEALPAND